MAAIRRSYLALEFHLDEIRAVEARTGIGGAVNIINVGAVPMPEFATENGRIKHRPAIVEALKVLMSQVGSSCKTAYVGIPAQAIALRLMDLPLMPEADLRAVMQGEIQHLQLLSEPGAAFDYVELAQPTEGAPEEHRFLVMAIEESTLTEYREVVRSVGLEVEAFEPITIGLYRSAYPLFEDRACALFVSITELRSEVAIVTAGKIAFYRRLNVGTDELCPPQDGTQSPDPDIPITVLAPTAGPEVDAAAARSFATEIRRSVDYYRRQYTDARDVEVVVMACSHQRGEAIQLALERNLQTQIGLAIPPQSTAPGLQSELQPPSGLRFTGAFGLATHPAGGKTGMPPRFDLIDPIKIIQQRASVRFMLAMGFSALIFMCSLMAMIFFMQRANELDARLTQKQALLAKFIDEQKFKTDEQLKRQAQLTKLAQEGVPLPEIMDRIVLSLSDGASLDNIRIDTSGRIVLTGLAKTADAVYSTTDRLKRNLESSAQTDQLEDNSDPVFPDTKKFVISLQYPLPNPDAPA